MNTLIADLIDTTHFDQAGSIWQENLALDVFEPFFACMLAQMASDAGFAFYDGFISQTHEPAHASINTGGVAPTLATFWTTEPNALIRQKIADATLVDEQVLSVVLPLAAHTGFGALRRMAHKAGTSIQNFVRRQLPQAVTKLPAWASLVIDVNELTRLTALANEGMFDGAERDEPASSAVIDKIDLVSADPTTNPMANDDSERGVHAQTDGLEEEVLPPKARSIRGAGRAKVRKNKDTTQKSPAALLLGLGALLLAGAGGAYYYFSQKQSAEEVPSAPEVQVVDAPAVQALPPSRLSITVGQAGELYACHAELGSNALADKLIALLQANFASTMCVIDTNESLGSEMAGLDKLTSVIGLLKTAPFASLELSGNTVYINAQNPNDITRLVADIGALMAGTTVMPMPAVDGIAKANEGINQATAALNGLSAPVGAHALARALSLLSIDTSQSAPSPTLEPIWAQAGAHLKATPDVRLMIVVHRDDTGDKVGAQTQTQMFADAIKGALLAQGVADGQLTAIGVGSALPTSDNVTEIGRQKNRRVEFLVYDEAVMQSLLNANQTAMTTAPMPAAPVGAMPMGAPVAGGAQPTYTVVNGQIVEQSVANQMMATAPPPEVAAPAQAPAYQAPAYQAPPSNYIAPAGEAVLDGGVPMPSAAPVVPAPVPTGGADIDEDLLRPIGIEPIGGSAVQRANN